MSSPTAPLAFDRPEDRRRSPRHVCSVPVRCRNRPWWLLGTSWPAVLCNASVGGICLHTQRPEEVGNVLYVELTRVPAAAGVRRLRAQVLHSRQTPVLHDWVLGCALQEDELTDEELRSLAD
jgi:hypothetical protein